jgi:GPH family glycoside/pentoside/hexuronide:cation symporter
LLWGAVPFAVIGVLTFYTPDFDEKGKIIYAYITYSAMMMIYSLINVPYASLLGVMSSDRKERTTLSSYRMFFCIRRKSFGIMAYRAFGELLRRKLKLKNRLVGNNFGFRSYYNCFFLGMFFLNKIKSKTYF